MNEHKRLGGWQRKLAKLSRQLEMTQQLVKALQLELAAKNVIIDSFPMEKTWQKAKALSNSKSIQ